MELPDEIVAAMKPYKTEEQSHRRRMRLHKVYSLDRGGLDGHILFTALTPCELYERKVTYQELYTALRTLYKFCVSEPRLFSPNWNLSDLLCFF